jgi:hypothetical protein
MRRTIAAVVLAGALVGCTKTVIVAAPTPSAITVSAMVSPPAQTPIQRLQAVLDANPQIQADVCYHSKQLVSVGWPTDLLPSLLQTQLPKREIAQLQSVGMKLKNVLTDLIHRC